MNQLQQKKSWLRDELLHLLTLSGTLAGLCVAGVTLFHTMDTPTYQTTLADELLAFTALLFLICTYVIFFALRTKREKLALLLNKLVDILFFLALTSMVFSGFVMIYAIM